MSESSNFPTVMPSLLLDFANAKQLDPRVTFTRASTATYYDEDTVAKAEENLFLQSQTFENASWIVTNSTITANTSAAPDGTTTAETITASAGTGQHLVRQDPSAIGTLTASVFAKAGTHNFLQIFHGNSANYFADFDLSAGTVGTTGASTTASIVSVGSGWYRCIITFTTASNSAIRFAIVSSSSAVYNESWTAVGTETVLLWGAQLEQRSAVTAYTVTTTQPITNYIPVLMTAAVGVPRFNFNPTTRESLGLLIEEQRVNLIFPSDGTGSFGNTTNLTFSPIVTPSGNIVSCLWDSTGNTANRYQLTITAGTFSTGQLISVSWFQKRVKGTGIGKAIGLATLVNATVTTSEVKITDVGNGWERWAGVVSVTDGALQTILRLYISNPVTDGVFNAFAIWGLQMEAGAFPTSYIPTVASSVTRSADTASMTGVNFSQWYRADEGTLYAEGKSSYITGAGSGFVSLNNGTLSKRIELYAGSESHLYIVDNGQVQVNMDLGSFTKDAFSKVAAAYAVNNFGGSLDSSIVSDTLGTVPTVDKLFIGDFVLLTVKLNGTIKKVAYYPARLTNAQLQALTS